MKIYQERHSISHAHAYLLSYSEIRKREIKRAKKAFQKATKSELKGIHSASTKISSSKCGLKRFALKEKASALRLGC